MPDEEERQDAMAGQKIRIRLKSYDHEVIDSSARKIVDTVTSAGATVVGPVPLPTEIEPSMKYKPVAVSGTTTGQEIDILSGTKDQGGGYQIVSRFITDDGRAILLDRGFIAQDFRHAERPPVRLKVHGNLHWPEEKSSSTPAPNLTENIWFARDVPAMAQQLNTLPILVVASSVQGDAQGVEPIPVTIEGIPNNHLSYAMQWFMIAAVWAGMTLALIWRIRQRTF